MERRLKLQFLVWLAILSEGALIFLIIFWFACQIVLLQGKLNNVGI